MIHRDGISSSVFILFFLLFISCCCAHLGDQQFSVGYWGVGEEPRAIEIAFWSSGHITMFDNAIGESEVIRGARATAIEIAEMSKDLEACLRERAQGESGRPLILISYGDYQRQYRIDQDNIPDCAQGAIELVERLGNELFKDFSGFSPTENRTKDS